MKLNWKIAVAALLIIGAAYWAFTSVRATSFDAANLNFGVGNGAVTVTNPSSDPVAAQLVGTGSRTFTVASTTDGMSGVSVKAGTGSSITQTFAFSLPAGVSEFTVLRGTNVQFVGLTDTRLLAVSNSMSSDQMRTTILITIAVILVALYFMSNETGHKLVRTILNKPAFVPVVVTDTTGGQGRSTRSYGDNTSGK